MHEGPFMGAAQFVGMCKELSLMEPEGELGRAIIPDMVSCGHYGRGYEQPHPFLSLCLYDCRMKCHLTWCLTCGCLLDLLVEDSVEG